MADSEKDKAWWAHPVIIAAIVTAVGGTIVATITVFTQRGAQSDGLPAPPPGPVIVLSPEQGVRPRDLPSDFPPPQFDAAEPPNQPAAGPLTTPEEPVEDRLSRRKTASSEDPTSRTKPAEP